MNLLDLINGHKILKINTHDGNEYFVESIDFVKRHIVVKNHKEFQQGIIEFDKISKWINVEK